MSNVSSLDRLKNLPEVFTLQTAAAMFDWDTRMASQYITRWKRSALVSSLGDRTGVHFNLLKNPEAPADRLLDAVKYLFPAAVITGASALHEAGVTTQIPQAIEIAVPWRASAPKISGVEVTMRPSAWFGLMRPSLVKGGVLPRLAPEAALADDWQRGGWRPDPDDIDWDDVDGEKLKAAFASFQAEIPDLWQRHLDADGRPGW